MSTPPWPESAGEREEGTRLWPGALVYRLAMIMIVVVVLVATASATWVLRLVDREALEQLSVRQAEEVETLASLLSTKIEQSQKVLRTLGQELSEPVLASPASMAWLIEHGWAAVQWFDTLMVAHSDGELQMLWRDGRLQEGNALGSHERDALRRTLSSGKPLVSTWQPEGEGTEMQVLFTMPVLQREGGVSAVVAGGLRLHSQSVLPSMLWQAGRSESRLLIFTRDGLVLAHTDAERRLSRLQEEPGLSRLAARWQDSNTEQLPQRVLTQQEGPWLVSVAAMPLPQWLVARVTDVPTALALGPQTRGVLLATLGGGALVLALLCGLAVLWLMRPLTQVQVLARQLAVDTSRPQGLALVSVRDSVHLPASDLLEDDMQQLTQDVLQLSSWGQTQHSQGQRERLRWNALLEHLSFGVLLSRRHTVEQGSVVVAQLLGYAPSQLPGMRLRALFAQPMDFRQARRKVLRSFRHHRAFDGELRLRRQDGSSVWMQARGRLMPVEGGQQRMLWELEDLGLQHALLRMPGWQLLQDPLTQLLNRKGFTQRLHAWLQPQARSAELGGVRLRAAPSPAAAAVARSGGVWSGVLLFLDLDHFKVINDLAGHPAGDDVLVRLARLLEGQVGQSGWVARLGGDEFVAVLPGCSPAYGWQVAEHIRVCVQAWEPLYAERHFALTVSIGLVMLDASCPVDDLVRQADLACYEAKHQGRNRIAQPPSRRDGAQRAVA